MKHSSIIGVVLVAVIIFSGLTILSNKKGEDSGFVPGIGGGPGNIREFPRSRLQLLLNEHGTLASAHLSALYDAKDTAQTTTDLELNNQKIADLLVPVGFNREEFLRMWEQHIISYEEYTKAVRSNDRHMTDQIRIRLGNQAREMGIMMNKALPATLVETLSQLTQEHIDLSLGIIEAHARGDSHQKVTLMDKASAQAIKFANIIADGVDKR